MNPGFPFDVAFDIVVVGGEGGYVNHPDDPGGETNLGITKRDWPNEDIPNMTPARAKAIYEPAYWKAAHCDKFPWPLSLYVFDCAVNQGVDAAVKLLQKTAGTVQDGVIGQNTLRAILGKDQKELCA